ncbi:MAG TPA: glycosyltransferase family 2 protein [Bryobacteraceae bacterium]|jgi:GT2 family glycosyltransferase
MPQAGIVIVTYNSQAEIGECLDAAITSGAEIVVVDNASSDRTVAEVEHRKVRLIANSSNRGFAAAVNQGFSVLDCEFILVLNPDAVLQSGLDPLIDACRLPHAAGAGGSLLDSEGRPQIGFMVRKFPTSVALVLESVLLNRLWPDNPVNRSYRCLGLDYSIPSAVEQPAGAFLMLRRDVWQELRGFDEGFYPLWFEDVDFCRRAVDRGYQLYFAPHAVAKHTGAHSIVRLPVEMRRFYWYRSLLRYSARHFHAISFRVVCLAVVLGSLLRVLGESVSQLSLSPMAVYGKVVRLAGRCLFFGWRDEAVLSGPRN